MALFASASAPSVSEPAHGRTQSGPRAAGVVGRPPFVLRRQCWRVGWNVPCHRLSQSIEVDGLVLDLGETAVTRPEPVGSGSIDKGQLHCGSTHHAAPAGDLRSRGSDKDEPDQQSDKEVP
jgi:hypothetical protein